MKIGIVTPFDSRNFGNRLQNYALQQVLGEYADQVVTIKNKPAPPEGGKRLCRSSPLAESVMVNALLGEKRKAAILRFNRDHLEITGKTYWCDHPCTHLRRQDVCDWYCAGSDQIWNPNLHRDGGFNYLTFAPQMRTFSYAASFGVAGIPEEKADAVRKGLNHIRFLSLREEAGKDLAQTLTGRKDIRVLPDPVLLLTKEQWAAVEKPPKKPLPEGYMLTYFLGAVSPGRRKALSLAAEKENLEILDLMDPASPFYAIGPGEFLYLISRAKLVCTDSFHGSVFSFLYGCPLLLFSREGEGSEMESRMDTLVKTYHLEACQVKENCLRVIPKAADYRMGYDALERERRRAREFLEEIFREAGP